MLEIGRMASLAVVRAVPMGVMLGRPEQEILLPTRYVPEGAAPGDVLEVFLYTDSEDRPIATTERPLAQVGEFACLRVVTVSRMGAFLDWGLPKDLLLPFRSQPRRVRPGDRVVVRVLLDERSGRPVASAKIERFLEAPPGDLREGQAVALLVHATTDLGAKAIVDGRFGGLLYHEPGVEPLEVGASATGSVKRIREDGKIDLSLAAAGWAGLEADCAALVEALERGGGRLELGDRSEPEAIRRTLGMSKKRFKRAAGALYRERRIRVGEASLERVEPRAIASDSG